MQRVIHKYLIEFNKSTVKLPSDHSILHVGHQRGLIYLWIEVDPSSPKKDIEYKIVATGGIVPEGMLHIGSVQINESLTEFVWHVYMSPHDVVDYHKMAWDYSTEPSSHVEDVYEI